MAAVDHNNTKPGNPFHQLYSTQSHNRLLASEKPFNTLVEQVNFGNASMVHKLELLNGRTSRENVDVQRLNANRIPQVDPQKSTNALRIFLLKCSQFRVELTQQAFLHLLETCSAPASYLNVLFDNNGGFSSHVVHSSDGQHLQEYYMLVKLPFGPSVNGSVMFGYNFPDDCATCLLSTRNLRDLSDRFMELDTPNGSNVSSGSSPMDPFVILGLFLEHISAQMEDDRVDVDRQVCIQEARSGVALHNFSARGRAKISEYAEVKRGLHLVEGLLAMFEHIMMFQVELAAFLAQEHRRFSDLRQQEATRRACHLVNVSQQESIQASLCLNANMAKWRLEQARVLNKRVQIQLRVTESSISAYDTLNALRLARDSRSDSVSMKAITILTMAFLPATFVATIFSMGFFDYSLNSRDEMELRVAPQVWMYVVVTVPLTLVVLGVCAAWLKWNSRRLEGRVD